MERSGTHHLKAPHGRPTNATEVVDYIIASALRFRASDIHIGTCVQGNGPEASILRFRIHGKLQVVKSDFLAPHFREVIARIKILAAMSTTEINSPLDGQIPVDTEEGAVTLRVNTVPSQGGEEICIRLQRGSEKAPPLDQLMMTSEMSQSLSNLIRQKSGLIVLNGPAGSGKTTTIYSIISALASPERKIVTAEDPIELRLPYVSHTQISPRTSYAALSRAFMRQDAEVIFIGEVRDAESAAAAIQLAQTGHLVLTTLHTRDAIGVISRLEALELHPNFIATSLIASLSQRLVPRLCAHCRVDAAVTPALLQALQKILPAPPGARIFQAGPGCPHCVGGTVGRVPIFELFVADAQISDMINLRASKAQVLEAARRKGMRTLDEEALIRVYGGLVDLASVQSFIFGPTYFLGNPENQARTQAA